MSQIRRLSPQSRLLASPFRLCVHALIPPRSGMFIETIKLYAEQYEAYRFHLELTVLTKPRYCYQVIDNFSAHLLSTFLIQNYIDLVSPR